MAATPAADVAVTAPLPPPAAKRNRTDGAAALPGVATRSNYFTVDDIVWVRPKGFPFWPAEVVSAEDAAASIFRCKLFCPPTEAVQFVTSPATNIFFFDKLYTDEQIMEKIETRLQRASHKVEAYEEAFVAAVREANALVRVVMDPNVMLADRERHAVTCHPVGIVHCYHRTHTSAPRQPHTKEVTTPASAIIRLATGFENAVRDLKGFDRIWVMFHFSYATTYSDESDAKGFKCLVVPPRDTVARGVFATRSPHRPNPVGLSCVRLVDVRGLDVHIADHDLLHGTPVLDIKPYLPFCDAHPQARAGWVDKLDASGKAKGDHRESSADDVALCRLFPDGRKIRLVDPVTGRPVTQEALEPTPVAATSDVCP